MRLFQDQMSIENYNPPPSFSQERQGLRNMPILQNYRNKRQRLPTPDKVAIMDLSNSFEKRRLGKQQQILSDISQRCREQEVGDLSSKLTAKCKLVASEKQDKDVSMLMTTFMSKQPPSTLLPLSEGVSDSPRSVETKSPGPLRTYDRSYKHFPARKIIKHQTKYDLGKVPPSRSTGPRGSPTDYYNQFKLAHSQKVKHAVPNEMDSTSGQDYLGPLAVPRLNLDNGSQERVDLCFSTSRVTLGLRSRTHTLIDLSSVDIKSFKSPNVFHPVQINKSQDLLEKSHTPPPTAVTEQPRNVTVS